MYSKKFYPAQKLCLHYASFVLALFFLQLGTATAAISDDIKTGYWSVVSQNTINDIDLCPDNNCTYTGIEGVSAVIDDWNGGAFASGYGTLGGLVVWGGGHKGYYGNEVIVFSLDTQKWELASSPVTDPVCDYTYDELQDGSPCSMHTYDYVDYHPGSNSFVLLGSASPHDKGTGGKSFPHMFSFDSNTWRRGNTHTMGDLTGASSAYDPKRDVFWLIPAYNKYLSKFDPNANGGAGQWTKYSQFNIEIDAVTAVDPDHDLLVTAGNLGTNGIFVHDLSNPDADGIRVTTSGDKTMENSKAFGFEWDPTSKKFVSWSGGTSLYTLTPPSGDWKTEAWVWDKITPASDNSVNPGAPNSNNTYSRFRYVPSLNAFIVINGVDKPVYMFKLTDGVNPLASLNFSVSQTNVDAGQSISFTWSSINAVTCSAGGDWSGTKSTSSSEIVGPVNSDSTFYLWCSNASNVNVGRSLSVSVNSVSTGSTGSTGSGGSGGSGGSAGGNTSTASGGGGGSINVLSNVIMLLLLFLSKKSQLKLDISVSTYKKMIRKLGNIGTVIFTILFLLPVSSAMADAQSDFVARSNDSNVVFSEGFDTVSSVEGVKRFPDSKQAYATFTNLQSASGSGALQFEIPAQTGATMTGTWRTNFSDDESIKFGAGDDLYVQWRQRFSASMLDSIYEGGGGWKQIIIGQGDDPGYEYGDAGETSSCTSLELVIQNVLHRSFPQAYHNCGEYIPFVSDFNSEYNAYDFKFQNAIHNLSGTNDKERYVLYSQEDSQTNSVRSDFPGMAYFPNEWMTFQVHLKLGPLGTAIDSLSGQSKSGFTNSTIEMWVAREGQASVKTHSFTGVVLRREDGGNDTAEKYGKIWLLAFNTGKDASKSYPIAHTWYDELIISRSKIADPGFINAPIIDFYADPASVVSGGTTNLVWNVSNATECTKSAGWADSDTSVLGSKGVGPLTSDSSYVLTCTGNGSTVSEVVVVNISANGGNSGSVESSEPASVTSGASGGGGSADWMLLSLILSFFFFGRRFVDSD